MILFADVATCPAAHGTQHDNPVIVPVLASLKQSIHPQSLSQRQMQVCQWSVMVASCGGENSTSLSKRGLVPDDCRSDTGVMPP